jgi:hypothetical protein
VSISQVRALDEELGDSGELMSIKLFQQHRHILSYWIEHVLDVSNPLECWREDLFTPIVWMGFAAEVSGPLQSGNHTSDRASSETGERRQFASGHRSTLTKQIEAFVIGRADLESLGYGFVKQHDSGAVPADQTTDDNLDQLVLTPARASAGSCSHNRLDTKLYSEDSRVVNCRLRFLIPVWLSEFARLKGAGASRYGRGFRS